MKSIISHTVLSILILLINFSVMRSQSNYWERTNGPYGTYVYTIAEDKDGNLLAGTDLYGIYRSIDDGISWKNIHPILFPPLITGGYVVSQINKIAVSKKGTIFVAAFAGFILSSDNGTTWKTVPTTGSASAVATSPSGIVLFASASKIIRSTDDGQTWNTFKISDTSSAYQPSIYSIIFKNDTTVFAAGRNGVFKSYDAGQTWSRCNYGLQGDNFYSMIINTRGELYIGSLTHGVFRTTDDGITWTQLNVGLPNPWVKDISIDPVNTVYAATLGYGIFRLIDNGKTWIPINNELRNLCATSLYMKQNGFLYCGTDGSGVFNMNIDVQKWSQGDIGLGFTSTLSLDIDSQGAVYAATEFYGLYRTSDNGNHWVKRNEALPNSHVERVLSNSHGDAFASFRSGVKNYNQNYGLYKTTNFGEDWMQIYPAYLEVSAMDSKGFIYTPNLQGILRSTDDGNSWQTITPNQNMSNIDIIKINKGGDIFATTNTTVFGVYRTTDDGKTWQLFGADSLKGIKIYDIHIYSPDTLFIASDKKIFRSFDNGGTWTKALCNGLTDSLVWCIARDDQGTLYAGTWRDGIFLSRNKGDDWTAFNEGLNNMSIKSIVVASDGTMYVGTWEGVYKRKLRTSPTIVPSINSEQFTIRQNYPNPISLSDINSSTAIEFSISSRTHVKLKLYDLLGKEIITLVDGEKEPSSHTVHLDLRTSLHALSPGVYFYRLYTDKMILTKKMIVTQ